MPAKISEMSFADYEDALKLWERCEGIGLSDADEPGAMRRFLEMNAGFNFVARLEDEVVGTVLCGTDWRRGYLYHLAVNPRFRRQGIGRELVERVFASLKERDIHKCHIMVFGTNQLGLKFWRETGWVTRLEIVLMSYDLSTSCGGSPC